MALSFLRFALVLVAVLISLVAPPGRIRSGINTRQRPLQFQGWAGDGQRRGHVRRSTEGLFSRCVPGAVARFEALFHKKKTVPDLRYG
jgi:hypothetical protein